MHAVYRDAGRQEDSPRMSEKGASVKTRDRIGQVFCKCFKEAIESCDGWVESSHLYWVSKAMVQLGVLES